MHQLRRVAVAHGRQSEAYALHCCRRARSGTRANRLVQTADTRREWWVTVDGECVVGFKGDGAYERAAQYFRELAFPIRSMDGTVLAHMHAADVDWMNYR